MGKSSSPHNNSMYKNMQTAGKVQVVQLPRLHNVKIMLSIANNVEGIVPKIPTYSKFKIGRVWFL